MPSPTTGGGGEKIQLQWFWALLVLQGQPALVAPANRPFVISALKSGT